MSEQACFLSGKELREKAGPIIKQLIQQNPNGSVLEIRNQCRRQLEMTEYLIVGESLNELSNLIEEAKNNTIEFLIEEAYRQNAEEIIRKKQQQGWEHYAACCVIDHDREESYQGDDNGRIVDSFGSHLLLFFRKFKR